MPKLSSTPTKAPSRKRARESSSPAPQGLAPPSSPPVPLARRRGARNQSSVGGVLLFADEEAGHQKDSLDKDDDEVVSGAASASDDEVVSGPASHSDGEIDEDEDPDAEADKDEGPDAKINAKTDDDGKGDDDGEEPIIPSTPKKASTPKTPSTPSTPRTLPPLSTPTNRTPMPTHGSPLPPQCLTPSSQVQVPGTPTYDFPQDFQRNPFQTPPTTEAPSCPPDVLEGYLEAKRNAKEKRAEKLFNGVEVEEEDSDVSVVPETVVGEDRDEDKDMEDEPKGMENAEEEEKEDAGEDDQYDEDEGLYYDDEDEGADEEMGEDEELESPLADDDEMFEEDEEYEEGGIQVVGDWVFPWNTSDRQDAS